MLFDKAPGEKAEIERAFGVMQQKYHNMRFVLVEDPAILPSEVAETAISSIIVLRQPLFTDFLGIYDNVVITQREDG